jgi:hypothetical protein
VQPLELGHQLLGRLDEVRVLVDAVGRADELALRGSSSAPPVGASATRCGRSARRVVPGGRRWIAFLVPTIAGERLELSRFPPPSPVARHVFAGIVAWLLAALAAWPLAWAPQLFGAGLLALAAWLARQDIARSAVRQRRLTRFIAVCLLSGYAWLAFGGAVMSAAGLAPGGPAYDAALHALLLGFVFAMVFGHAPIVFPAVLRVAVPYRPVFCAPLVLLHAALVLRVAGAALRSQPLLRWGGLGSALALVAFFAVTVIAAVRAAGARP